MRYLRFRPDACPVSVHVHIANHKRAALVRTGSSFEAVIRLGRVVSMGAIRACPRVIPRQFGEPLLELQKVIASGRETVSSPAAVVFLAAPLSFLRVRIRRHVTGLPVRDSFRIGIWPRGGLSHNTPGLGRGYGFSG